MAPGGSSSRAEVEHAHRLLATVPQNKKEREELVRSLQTQLSLWQSRRFGLGDPSELEVTRTSLRIAAVLLPDTTVQMKAMLAEFRAELERAPSPALAMALAQGWDALDSAGGPSLRREERIQGLRSALERLAPGPESDPIACRLADRLARHRTMESGGAWIDEFTSLLDRHREDVVFRPFALAHAADYLRTRGRWAEAWDRLQEVAAVRGSAAQGDPALERTVAAAEFQLALACGQPEVASAALAREREAVAAGAGDPASRMDVLWNLASLAMAVDSPELKRKYIAEVEDGLSDEELAAALPVKQAALAARHAMAVLLLEEAEPPESPVAPELLLAAAELPEQDEVHRQNLLFLLLGLADGGGDSALAREIYGQLRELDERRAFPRENAWYLAAWGGRLALSEGAGADPADLLRAEQEVEAAFAELLGTFAEMPSSEGGVGFLDTRGRRLLLETRLRLALRRAGESDAGRREAFRTILAYEGVGSLARRLGAREESLEPVLPLLLSPGTGLVVYVHGFEATHVLWFDRDQSGYSAVPWPRERERVRQSVERRLARVPERLAPEPRQKELLALQADLRRLSGWLLPEELATRAGTWSGIHVVGADLLGLVPFEALSIGAEPAGQTHAITFLPSVTVGAALARRAQGPAPLEADDLLLVAAPTLSDSVRARHSELVPFPFASDRLTRAFSRAPLLIAEAAGILGLEKNLAARSARIWSFVTHGVFDPKREFGAGLVLAPDERSAEGVLWAADLLRSGWSSPELVVLAACHSARGTPRGGEDGLWQLDGAFFALGTQCSVQAGWKIGLEPTLALLEVFLEETSTGATPAEAMRRARRALARDPEYQHPFYAQSLRVAGLGLRPLFTRKAR